jgi:hypothetical protein
MMKIIMVIERSRLQNELISENQTSDTMIHILNQLFFLPGNLANCYFINECKKINGKRYYLFLTLLQGLNPLSLVRCLSGPILHIA